MTNITQKPGSANGRDTRARTPAGGGGGRAAPSARGAAPQAARSRRGWPGDPPEPPPVENSASVLRGETPGAGFTCRPKKQARSTDCRCPPSARAGGKRRGASAAFGSARRGRLRPSGPFGSARASGANRRRACVPALHR